MHDSLPTSARGRARVLSDKELDATYAQGLAIVNVSFGVRHGGGSFSFDATTRINTPNTATAGGTVGFLGGAVSVSTGSNALPNGTSNTSGVNVAQTNSVPRVVFSNVTTGGSTGTPPVSVSFGTLTGSGANRVLGITAAGGVTVDSVVNIRVGVARQIRNLFGPHLRVRG
jgi:hypothetical protein